jgi:hypothetical protein
MLRRAISALADGTRFLQRAGHPCLRWSRPPHARVEPRQVAGVHFRREAFDFGKATDCNCEQASPCFQQFLNQRTPRSLPSPATDSPAAHPVVRCSACISQAGWPIAVTTPTEVRARPRPRPTLCSLFFELLVAQRAICGMRVVPVSPTPRRARPPAPSAPLLPALTGARAGRGRPVPARGRAVLRADAQPHGAVPLQAARALRQRERVPRARRLPEQRGVRPRAAHLLGPVRPAPRAPRPVTARDPARGLHSFLSPRGARPLRFCFYMRLMRNGGCGFWAARPRPRPRHARAPALSAARRVAGAPAPTARAPATQRTTRTHRRAPPVFCKAALLLGCTLTSHPVRRRARRSRPTTPTSPRSMSPAPPAPRSFYRTILKYPNRVFSRLAAREKLPRRAPPALPLASADRAPRILRRRRRSKSRTTAAACPLSRQPTLPRKLCIVVCGITP